MIPVRCDLDHVDAAGQGHEQLAVVEVRELGRIEVLIATIVAVGRADQQIGSMSRL